MKLTSKNTLELLCDGCSAGDLNETGGQDIELSFNPWRNTVYDLLQTREYFLNLFEKPDVLTYFG